LLEYIINKGEYTMSIEHIVITTDSFHSQNKYDIISSNIHYITKLFQHNLREDKISQEALKSYYVDYYLSHILHGGFSDFIENFKHRDKIIYYIRSGLEALEAKNHLILFNRIFLPSYNDEAKPDNDFLNMSFKKIQESENLIEINRQWLIKHPQLLIIKEEELNSSIQEHIINQTEEKRHIKIIKQLCEIIEEDFIAVTAGDSRNIYNRSWHFKTAQGFYYMIEKNNIVTLYNSFTKEEITQGRLIANKTEKSIVSDFISQMLA